MQCPECGHQAPVADFGDPLRCPDCGIYYEKAVQLNAEKAARPINTQQSSNASHIAEMKKNNNKILTGFVFVLGFGALVVFASHNKSGISNTSSQQPKLSPLALAKRDTILASKTRIEGPILMADFSIQNTGKNVVKDIEITCRHRAPSGTEIDRNTRVIYEIVRPGETKQFFDFNMGFVHSQVATTRCELADLKI